MKNGDISMNEKAKFEDNISDLGKIVAELEKGDIPLDRAVELYTEGIRLSAECKKQLSEAKIKITEVDGELPPQN